MSKTLTSPLPQYAISPSLEKGGLKSIQTSKNHQLALAWTGKWVIYSLTKGLAKVLPWQQPSSYSA